MKDFICLLYVSSLYLGSPRLKGDEGHFPFVVIIDNDGHLSLNMTAYPTPYVKAYYKLNSNEPIQDRMQTTCAAESDKPASIVCNITVISVTNADDGAQFMVLFSNDLREQLPFSFRIRLNGKLLDKQ